MEESNIPVRQTLARLGINKSTFYNWLKRLNDGGLGALHDRKPKPRSIGNKLSLKEQDGIIELALDKPELSPRELYELEG